MLNHQDMLDRTVAIGDTVAYSQANCLYIGRVSKLTAKRVHVTRLGSYNWTSQQLPRTFIKLNEADIMTWLLKGAKNTWNFIYDGT